MRLTVPLIPLLCGCLGLNGFEGTWTIYYEAPEALSCTDDDYGSSYTPLGEQLWTLDINVLEKRAHVVWIDESMTLTGPVDGKKLKAAGSTGSSSDTLGYFREDWTIEMARKGPDAEGVFNHLMVSGENSLDNVECTRQYAFTATRVGR